MNTPSPVDPDKLRARLAQAVEPMRPSPDALVRIKAGARRRRRLQWTLGSGAGVVAVAGATAAVIAAGSLGHGLASPRTLAPGYSPTASAAPATTLPPSATPSPRASVASPPVATIGTASAVRQTSASAGSTPVTTQPVTSSPVSSALVTTTTPGPGSLPVAHDVDGDGKADTTSLSYAGLQATLRVHLATATVASKPFLDGPAAVGGRTTFADVNGDGRSEVLVQGGGATGVSYYLFQYVAGALVQVPPVTGSPTDAWLFSGGGGGGGGDFGCVAGHLEISHYEVEASTVNGAYDARRYDVSAYTVRLSDGHVVRSLLSSQHGVTMTQAGQFVTQHSHDRCGAPL